MKNYIDLIKKITGQTGQYNVIQTSSIDYDAPPKPSAEHTKQNQLEIKVNLIDSQRTLTATPIIGTRTAILNGFNLFSHPDPVIQSSIRTQNGVTAVLVNGIEIDPQTYTAFNTATGVTVEFTNELSFIFSESDEIQFIGVFTQL
jgi:hypothetical protein